jgi:hypothetical protein
MFAKATTNVGFAQRVVATLVASALVLLSVGLYNIAQAANLTDISDTLSDSGLSVAAAHTIAFTVPTASAYSDAGDIVITFPSGPGSGFTGVAASVQGDYTVTVNGGAAAIDSFDSTLQVVTLSLDTSATAGQEIVVALDAGIITNPDTVGSAEFVVTTGDGDTGKTRVAIVNNVLVSAIVVTAFDFVITGHATGTAVHGDVTTGSTSDTIIDFGVLSSGVTEILSQELKVTTNSRNGFVVTVHSDGNLESSTGAIIDNFVEGSDLAVVGTAWTSPVPTINDPTSWGHWGMTSTDGDINSLGGYYTAEFDASDSYIAASTTPREVFHHDGPSDGSTQNIGTTTVAYQVEITSLQEAADDYNTTLTYVATPTF